MAHLHNPQCVSLFLGWRWGRVSFTSSTMCLPLEWLIYIIHNVSPSSLGGGGGGAHLQSTMCLPLPWVEVGEWLIWGRGSFTSSTMCLPLPWVEVREGLIYIIHSVSPSTLGGGGGGAHLHPQCVSLDLVWRGEGGSCTVSPLEDANESHPHLHLDGDTLWMM